MNHTFPFSTEYLASDSDAFANLLERASSYFEQFEWMDDEIPSKNSSLHEALVDHMLMDVAARTFGEEHFDWNDDKLNEHWTFYPCGNLYDYCFDIEADYPAFSEEDFAEKLQMLASQSPCNSRIIIEVSRHFDPKNVASTSIA